MPKICRILICVLASFLILVLLVWLGFIANCEVLTAKYGFLFKDRYQSDTMLSGIDSFKVLSFDDKHATVYYVSEGRGSGNIVEYSMENGVWESQGWKTIWSASGSADGFIWPYIR